MLTSSSSTTTQLCSLPSEILWKIIILLNPVDLSNARVVSKQFNKYCDHPNHWTKLLLDPSTTISHHSTSATKEDNNDNRMKNDILTLWNLSDLKNVLEPHLALIETIQIWGVRDNIIRFLILHCNNLQELTISGWSTLSDHALRIPNQQLSLRRLRLVGQQKSNFTSLDAATFGKLITQCPQLEELSVVSCQIHIQADSFIKSFDPANRRDHHQEQQQQQQPNIVSPSANDSETSVLTPLGDSSPPPTALKSLTVATKRTWSTQHVTRLFQLCSSLQVLALVPDSKNITVENKSPTSPTASLPVLNNNHPLLEKNVESIAEEEMLEFDNILVYSL